MQFAELSHKIRLAIEHSRTAKALKESEERPRSFMDSATDAFSIGDADLRLVDLNRALSGLPPGTRKEDVLGRNYAEFLSGSDERGIIDRYREVIRTGIPFTGSGTSTGPRPGRRWLNVKCFRVGNGMGLVTTDFTREKEAEEKLRAAFAALTGAEYDGNENGKPRDPE